MSHLHLRFSPLPNLTFLAPNRHFPNQTLRFASLSSHPSSPRMQFNLSLPRFLQPRASSNPAGGIAHSPPKIEYSGNCGDGGSGSGRGHGGSGGTGGGNNDKSSGGYESNDHSDLGVLGYFINGWRSRVAADPLFLFKVHMEELGGLSSCVLGDMLSRLSIGLNELDFVFSTLVAGSILNFVLMYLLAPTAASVSGSALPAIFASCPTSHMFEPGAYSLVNRLASCPTSHMFEPGAYSLVNRLGTLVYKGALFAAVGLAAGLVGTVRKKMDPNFVTPNKPPQTLLNALTWAIHMGVSSEPGAYSLVNRLGTLVYKGTLFAAVGLAAGLVGTVRSNGLITMRKKMDPNFVTPNKPPQTLLNAFTWAIHMGVSSNLRYQTLNGVEFVLAKGFKASVILLRCLNNVLGGVPFVVLARLTGAQKVEEKVALRGASSSFLLSVIFNFQWRQGVDFQWRQGVLANSCKVDFSLAVTGLLEFIRKHFE